MLSARLPSILGSLAGQSQSCFGARVATDILSSHGFPPAACSMLRLIFQGGALFLLAGLFIWGMKHPLPSLGGKNIHAFLTAGPMLLALFLLGPQMDYKWIFFLFLLPAVLEIKKAEDAPRYMARSWPVLVMLYSWWTFFSDESSLRNALLKQGIMWLLMATTAFLCGVVWKTACHQRNVNS
jgi:hypothetical protein